MPRTAGALPATHGGDTEAPAHLPALQKWGQGLCLLCRGAALQRHRTAQGCRAATHPALQGHRALPGYRATSHPSLWGFRALPALQEYHPSITAETRGTATAGTQRHCRQSSTASLTLHGAKVPPIRHCRDAGAPCIIHPALHCHPSVPLTERGPLPTPVLDRHRPAALAAPQCSQTPQGRPLALHSPSSL